MQPTAVYLYCFAPAANQEPPRQDPIDPRYRLERLVCGDIVAIWSEVSTGLFCGEEADIHLRDPGWLTSRACVHEAVVENAMRNTAVFPVQFATLFASVESLNDFLAAHQSEISHTLSRLEGKLEWSVKGYVDRTKALQRAKRGSDYQSQPAATSGQQYLLEKRRRNTAETELLVWIQRVREKVAARLQPHARDFRERNHVDLGESEGMELALNWAFLLEVAVQPAFHADLRELSDEYRSRGMRFVTSGPLPPYSFTPPLQGGPLP